MPTVTTISSSPALRATPRSDSLAPFRVRSFRFQWPADILTSWAFEMELLILGWYVLVETHSVVLLTIFAALLNVGTLVAPMFGVVGDRLGQRTTLFCMRIVYLSLATTLAVLAFTGWLAPLYVFLIAGTAGLVRPSDIGVRSALIASTVPQNYLVSALGISRMTSDSARIMGALVGAGLFVAFGIGRSYLAVASFYLVSALLTLGTGPEFRHQGADPALARPSPWRDLKEGIVYICNAPRLLAAMCLAFLVNLVAFPLVTGLMPYVARQVYHTDETGLGMLSASVGCGALVGSVALTVVGERLRVGRVMLATAVVWFALLIVFAQMPSLVPAMLCLLLIGFAQSTSMVALAVILMRTAEAQYRGRVMGVRMLAIYGHPLGLLAAGPLIERIGYGGTATLYGAIGLLATLAIVLRWREAIWQPAAEPSEA